MAYLMVTLFSHSKVKVRSVQIRVYYILVPLYKFMFEVLYMSCWVRSVVTKAILN